MLLLLHKCLSVWPRSEIRRRESKGNVGEGREGDPCGGEGRGWMVGSHGTERGEAATEEFKMVTRKSLRFTELQVQGRDSAPCLE